MINLDKNGETDNFKTIIRMEMTNIAELNSYHHGTAASKKAKDSHLQSMKNEM